MEYNRLPNGKLEKLKQQNIDTGMGVERTAAMLQGKDDVYETELFTSIIQTIEKISKKKYQGKNKKSMRIIADHLRAATFAIADGVTPSNVEAGYIVRRLIRRAVWSGRELDVTDSFLSYIAKGIVDIYQGAYPHLKKNKNRIYQEFSLEEKRFMELLSPQRLEKHKAGLEKISEQKLSPSGTTMGTADYAFNSLATYGIPPEMTFGEAKKLGLIVTDEQEQKAWQRFEQKLKKHQEISRAGMETKFAGGLADHSAVVTKLHTTTHLLHQALRDVLGDHVQQVGSNITPERLRFDFTHPEKLTETQMEKVEKIINQKIKANLPVKIKTMTLAEAKKKGALAFFGEKYSDKVKVYVIGDYSQEVCGGPHVKSTKKIGSVKIIKEKAIGAGRRRIYAQLAHGS